MNKPQRTCMSCKRKADKNEFVKIVRINGEVKIDEEQKLNGRSMYICKKHECILKTIKTKAISRALKTDVPSEIYKELERLGECSKS